MTEIIGIIFIVGCVAFYFYTKYETKVEHLENKIKKQEKDKFRSETRIDSLEKEIQKSKEQLQNEEEFEDFGYTSESQYNDAIDVIVKSVKYSPLARIYYEAQPPDQLNNGVSLRDKTQEHLRYLESKGVTHNDIIVAKEIIRIREETLGKRLDFEAFVIDTINLKGKDIADEIYLGLVKIFEVAGRNISSSTDVLYNRLFLDLPF
ncbi:hypothetical protein PK35_04380 [Tamlana nanhaiensis]|uniref:Uncharacterized protein n=1 Tax=Neotamlana nanhaiensis TaxID=1382798 RepID=A0A0D7W4L7_9FLAO|nr:hypothetical protein [Tamlana nanhaiensis]KJD33979.1 hypothetical protein PK35_04380 [Tamlana nanhaiensis]